MSAEATISAVMSTLTFIVSCWIAYAIHRSHHEHIPWIQRLRHPTMATPELKKRCREDR